jgi:HD-like signal output (HDOD) protein
LATALAAEAMAEACLLERSEAYTAGLLHDLGRLALVAAYPDEFATAAECWSRDGEAALRCEEEALGINHRQAGLLLAEKWGLPSILWGVLCTGMAPKNGPFTVTRLVCVACGVAERIGFSLRESNIAWDAEWLEQQLPSAAWARLGPKAELLRESIPLKINLFECEFLLG